MHYKKVKVFIQLLRPTDSDISKPVEFRYKPRSSVVIGKRQRMDSEYSSAEFLPTVLDEQKSAVVPNSFGVHDRISVEYNKSGVLRELYENKMDINYSSLQSEESFTKYQKMVDSKFYGMFKFYHFIPNLINFFHLELSELIDDEKLTCDGPSNCNQKLKSLNKKSLQQLSVEFIEHEINNIIDNCDAANLEGEMKRQFSNFISKQYVNDIW